MPSSAKVTIGRPGQFREFERACKAAFERAALRATKKAARDAAQQVRASMPGRLGGAITAGSDLDKAGVAHQGRTGPSASGWVRIRGGERAKGAIIAETEGANIVPVKGRWLAFPTDAIPKKAGRFKMTPALYRSTGLEQRIGPLEFVTDKHNRRRAYLIVRNVSVDRFGRSGSARALPRKQRRLRANRERRLLVVAFILIRATTRVPRVAANAILAANAARLGDLLSAELKKEF